MYPDDPGRGEPSATGLDRLDRAGNALLVVGRVPDGVHRRACGRLLGETEPRLRLRTDGAWGPDTGSAAGPDAASFDRTVDYGLTARGIDAPGSADAVQERGPGAATPAGATPEDGNATDGPRSLAAVGGEVARALDGLTPAGPGAPGVCVGSPLAMVDATDEPTVFRFLHTVAGAVRAADGRCHVHLPLPRAAERSLTFGAVTDGTVELRLTGDTPQQRLHVHGEETHPEWLALARPGPTDEDPT